MFFVRDTMKAWQLDNKYCNYLVAYWHARMGLSLVLHPLLSLFLSLFAFVSQQLWCFCSQVCTASPCQAASLKKQKGEKSYEGLFAIPNFPAILQDPNGLHMSLHVRGPAIVLLVGAAVEMRITQKMMLLGCIFTKGFFHSPGGVIWRRSEQKGQVQNLWDAGGNLNESTAEFFTSFLTNQSQEKFLHLFPSSSVSWAISQAIWHLIIWALHCPHSLWLFLYYFPLLCQFSGPSSISVRPCCSLLLTQAELCHPSVPGQSMDTLLAVPSPRLGDTTNTNPDSWARWNVCAAVWGVTRALQPGTPWSLALPQRHFSPWL